MSENNHYIIDLSRLPIGTHKFDVKLDDAFFQSLEKTEVLGGEVVGKAELRLREEDYSLRIAVHGTVFVVCDRCLDPMAIDIDDEQTIESIEEEDEEYKGKCESLNLQWLVYEIVSINIPLVHSHQAGECNKQMELLLQDHLCAASEPEN